MKKVSRKALALVTTFCLVITLAVVAVPMIVNAQDGVRLNFTAHDSSQGDVYYSTDGCANWNQVGESELHLTNVSTGSNDDLLSIRLVPKTGYELDTTKILERDGNTVVLNDTELAAIQSDAGYVFIANGAEILDVNAEFKESGSQPQPAGGFDGIVYFVWQDGGTICNKKLEGMQEIQIEPDGVFTKNTEITDAAGNQFDIGEAHYYMLPSQFTAYSALPISQQAELFGGNPDAMRQQYTLNPGTSSQSEKSVTETPGGIFRHTIYAQGYDSVTLDTNGVTNCSFNSDILENVQWKDISDTTASDPAVLPVYVEESTINIKQIASSISDTEIQKLEPLNVPGKAVTVTPTNDGYQIKFNSKYYDKVVFKATMANGNVGYIRVLRTAVRMSDNFGPNVTDSRVFAHYSYGTGSYSDYEAVFTVYDVNGNVKSTSVAQPQKIVDQQTGEVSDKYESTDGDIKYCQFSCPVTNKTDKVAVSIVKKGSDTTFGGVKAGSGAGLMYDCNIRQIIVK